MLQELLKDYENRFAKTIIIVFMSSIILFTLGLWKLFEVIVWIFIHIKIIVY